MKQENLPPFYVGQKVVCVNNKPLPGRTNTNCTVYLAEGDTYIVQAIQPVDNLNVVNLPTISLTGVFGQYCVSRFQPVQETFESISFSKVVEIEQPLISVN